MKSPARLRRIGTNLAVAVLGFAFGAIALYVHWVRQGPPLELWHTEELAGEFTAKRSPEIRSFDDYLRLEADLFERLDAQIYARTRSGPAFALARYSAGSDADPRGLTPSWNGTVELRAEQPIGGALLLHGMSDSPYSFRALAQTLARRGYWVIALRLPGHGTVPSALTTATWEDMAAAVELAMEHLAQKVGDKPIHIVGYSTGAPLALNHALDVREGTVAGPDPASLVLVSPAIGVSKAAALAGWLSKISRLPGLSKLAWTQIVPEFDPFKYNSFATNAGDQVHRLTRRVASRIEALGSIESFPPTLVFLSTVDATVSTEAVIDNLLEHLAPGRHELVLFDLNRRAALTTAVVEDPGPLTARLLADDRLPFHLTLLTNESPETNTLMIRRTAPLSGRATSERLELAWPPGIISLSHVALPIPPDDPLYGRRTPGSSGLNLGEIRVQGERGLLLFSADWLLRLRYNPFYEFLEDHLLEWLEPPTKDGT